MKNQKLFVEMKINNGNTSITVNCPNEDDEIYVTIKNRYKVNFSLTLDEAKDFAGFIISHVNNAKESNN